LVGTGPPGVQKRLQSARQAADDLADAETVFLQDRFVFQADNLFVGEGPEVLVDEGVANGNFEHSHEQLHSRGLGSRPHGPVARPQPLQPFRARQRPGPDPPPHRPPHPRPPPRPVPQPPPRPAPPSGAGPNILWVRSFPPNPKGGKESGPPNTRQGHPAGVTPCDRKASKAAVTASGSSMGARCPAAGMTTS